MGPIESFRESGAGTTPIRELGLTIAGSPLEPILDEFARELEAAGLRKVRPRFYLSTEWGVPEGTVAIAIPFYLARPDLTRLHAERAGYVEGTGRADILRYLRHEMGHVVNYAYELFARPDWVEQFGPITQPYEDDYRPEPFSRRHVRHLPGWYAQKHPDEDWAETFAVWMTPGYDWRAAYAGWPAALQKLDYCDRMMREVRGLDPLVTAIDLDWDLSNLDYSVGEHYESWALPEQEVHLPGIDGALRAIFERLGRPEGGSTQAERRPADELIRRWERDVMADVFRWTGHFPERTRLLLRHLAARAGELKQVYPADREERALLALSTLVTALAMNHVHTGSYSPDEAHGHHAAAPEA